MAIRPTPTASPPPGAAEDIAALGEQLSRMRSMLFAYSAMFFTRIRDWTIIAIALLLLGTSGLLPQAVLVVPFLVPFAFLETGYLYWYTVFARRHAARLEEAINAERGFELLAAHRLEAAYFDPGDGPRMAAFAFARPGSYPSLMTVGYTIGAGVIWAAGMLGTIQHVATRDSASLLDLVPIAAAAWTLAVVVALGWLFLGNADEKRLREALDTAYRFAGRRQSGTGAR